MRVQSSGVYLIQRHEFFCRIFFIFTEGCELDIIWSSCFISKGWLQSVQIMGTNGNKLTSPTNVLVKLVLEIYEGRVGSRRKFDIAKNGTSKKGPNPACLERIYHLYAIKTCNWLTSG
jgi:hypothetical protein